MLALRNPTEIRITSKSKVSVYEKTHNIHFWIDHKYIMQFGIVLPAQFYDIYIPLGIKE